MPSGGARKGAGRKTNQSKGLPTRKRLCFTLPPETYDIIMIARGNQTISKTIEKLVNEALMNRIGEEL